MKLLMATIVAGACLAMAGCGSGTKYTNPAKGQDQMEQDTADCDWEASRATGNLGSSGERSDRVAELIDKCMKAKGYKTK